MTQRLADEFINNSTGVFRDGQEIKSITPEDMRDFADSLKNSVGGYNITGTPVETVINTVGGYEKIAGTTAAFSQNFRFDTPADNRLRYIGDVPQTVTFYAVGSSVPATNNRKIGYRFAFNGITVPPTSVIRFHATGGDEGLFAMTFVFTMDTNDFVDVFIANLNGTENITVTALIVTAYSTFS